MYSILIVDDEKGIRAMLEDFFEGYFSIFSAENAASALDMCAKQQFDMVISDVNMPGMKGPELLMRIKQMSPQTCIVLMTAYNVDDYIRLARKSGISNIITKTAPFNFSEMLSLLQGLLSKDIFGIHRYMLPDFTSLGSFCIRSTTEAKVVREKVVDLFSAKFGNTQDIRLLVDEIVTNAIYHAPTLEDGSEKYQIFKDVSLEEHEYVHLECGFDKEKYGLAIIDNKGRLSRDTVLLKIERQMTGEGAMDDSGRGLHMSRLFSDRMIINIATKKKTEVILINYFSHKYQGYKPLYINEL